MNQEPNKQIVKLLNELNAKSPEMEASAVVTRDGLTVASALNPGVDPDRIGAMCAALLGLADTAATEMARGELKLVLLHGTEGVLLLVHIGQSHVLALSATTEIKLGMVLVDAKKAAATVATML